MSPEQLTKAIFMYTEARNSKNSTISRNIFDEVNAKTSKALSARRKELMESKTPKIERLDLSGIKKTRDDIISGKLKSIKGDVGQSIGDSVTPTPTNKSDGTPVIVNAPSTTNAPVNNNSTNVTSSSFAEPDGMFRRNSQFAL